MTSLIHHKRVEFTELFYDLVFVYAISKTTGLIHHLHDGVLSPLAFITFVTCLIVLVNTWMLQTMFTNRYGKNSLFNMLTMFVDMGLLMLLSNMFTLNWQSNFYFFAWVLGILSLSLLLQYVVQYRQSTKPEDKEMIKGFFYILGTRSGGVFLSTLLPYDIAIWVYFATIAISFVMPLFFSKSMNRVPINFPHLVERISLLVIITFGEMIMGVANFFTPETISINSVCYLIMVVSLFIFYFGEFDHALDESKETLGMRLIYSHYLIFTGLLMMTVSMTFLSEHEVNHLFAVSFLYSGLFLFLIAVLLNGSYNKPAYQWTKDYLLQTATLFAVGLVASLIFASSNHLVVYITTVVIFFIWLTFIRFYLKQHRLSKDPHDIHLI
ncbi:low temperature requirement protein A [Streptococcus saliviloxodontae]|uniref:Low temperature requirement protein LtrA n=1 Tax=Streptococcus saliviloxodontae TaxID=1349416 RepID=A0ABS2PLM4_9STRE|nr:low temperature requirement protein A [Streptococcus saliviloxodontae]MBM7636269.1 low temperature requirement protein LtrA [Streptococcus saliviloxodontae]